MRAAWVLTLFLLCGVVGATTASASSHPTTMASRPRSAGDVSVVHADGVYATGMYTVLTGEGLQGSSTILDERNGSRTTLPPAPQCEPEGDVAVGGHEIGVGCGRSFDTYRLPRGPWRMIAVPSQCALQAGAPSGGVCGLDTIGSRWLGFNYGCDHCVTSGLYEQLATGLTRAVLSTTRSAADLNAVGLAEPLCSPVTDKRGWAVTFNGSTVVETNAEGEVSGDVAVYRCGRAQPLVDVRGVRDITIRRGLVMWVTGETTLQGVCVPSARMVQPVAPARLSVVTKLVLSQRHMWVGGNTGSIGFQFHESARPGCSRPR
jgi:hypothetical protein